MNFQSIEISPRGVNCSKKHHSGSMLVHLRTSAMGSQSPTSKNLASDYWDRSMSMKWTQKRKKIPMNSLGLA